MGEQAECQHGHNGNADDLGLREHQESHAFAQQQDREQPDPPVKAHPAGDAVGEDAAHGAREQREQAERSRRIAGIDHAQVEAVEEIASGNLVDEQLDAD